jgi:endonuclease YncB( thermonuclease family)
MRMVHFNRILLLAAAAIFSAGAFAETVTGRVVAVADGDTVTVLDSSNTQWKIRLSGIDAPEKKMPYGQRSKQSLSDRVFNKHVTVEYSKRDKYGRTVGKILVDGMDANLEQIKAGLAWHYKKYEKEQAIEDRLTYAEEEERARSAKLGLWADAHPVPPWDWRKQQRTKE